jgi:hypothetical protein
LNSKTPPSKLSVVDTVVNRTLIIAISAMLIVCILSAIARFPLPTLDHLTHPASSLLPSPFSIVWEIDNNNASYLCLSKDDLNQKYGGQGCESGSTNSALTILTFATLFNNFVCIRSASALLRLDSSYCPSLFLLSMYVSLEMTYLWQAYFITQVLVQY